MMVKVALFALVGMLPAATPAIAHDTETAFASRGACESASAAMSNDEKDWLVATFPDLFDTNGEAASFLTRAWTCDRNPANGQFHITDHIEEILGSPWFANRNH